MTTDTQQIALGHWVEYSNEGRRFGIVYRISGHTVSIVDPLGRPVRKHAGEVAYYRTARIAEINQVLTLAREYGRGKHVIKGLIAARKARQAERREG